MKTNSMYQEKFRNRVSVWLCFCLRQSASFLYTAFTILTNYT